MLILHELVVILETLCTKKNGCNFKLRRTFLLILSEHNLGAVFSSLSKVWGQNSIFRFFVIFNAIYYLNKKGDPGNRATKYYTVVHAPEGIPEQYQYKGLSPGCIAGLQAEWFDRTELESQDQSAQPRIETSHVPVDLHLISYC